LDYSFYVNSQQQNLRISNLTQQVSQWNQSYYSFIQAWEWSQLAFHNLSGVYLLIQLPTSPISPPISADQALFLALQYGGWNLTSLQNATISIMFGSTSTEPNQTSFVVNETYGNISDYAPVQNGSVTNRYVWVIQIDYSRVVTFENVSDTMYRESSYLVDSAIGEVIPSLQPVELTLVLPGTP
jgi:hypothetical protein